MNRNKVSSLLEILDLDYLKPIIVDRYDTIDELAQVDLKEIGVENVNDSTKLRLALDELQGREEYLEQFDPILSIRDSDQIVTRIGNEIDLISSSLQLLFDDSCQNLPRDDATSDIEYRWCSNNIDQIEKLVEQLEVKTHQLVNRFDKNEQTKTSFRLWKEMFILFSLSMFSLRLMTYLKEKK